MFAKPSSHPPSESAIDRLIAEFGPPRQAAKLIRRAITLIFPSNSDDQTTTSSSPPLSATSGTRWSPATSG